MASADLTAEEEQVGVFVIFINMVKYYPCSTEVLHGIADQSFAFQLLTVSNIETENYFIG